MTTITALPTPPSRSDPTFFAARADSFLAALPTFATETNAVASEVNANANSAIAAYNNSVASLGGVTKWISGTTYADGQIVWSLSNFLNYRRKGAGAGTTDPSSDTTNYAQISINATNTLSMSTTGDEVIRMSSSGSPYISWHNGATRRFYIYASPGNIDLSTELSIPLVFKTNSVERLRIDAGGFVGIGTTTPSVPLDVNYTAASIVRVRGGNGVGQGASFFVTQPNSNNTLCAFGDRATATGGTPGTTAAIYTNAGIPFTFDIGGVEKVRIDSPGNIGIGVVPGTIATAAKVIDFTYPSFGMDSTGQGFTAFNLREESSGVWKYKSTDTGQVCKTTGGGWSWSTSPSGTAGSTASLVEKMRLDNQGILTFGSSSKAWVNGAKALQFSNGYGNMGSLTGGPVTHAFLSANLYATGTTDPGTTTWKYSNTGEAMLVEMGNGSVFSIKNATSGTGDTNATLTERLKVTTAGDTITGLQTAAPTLTVNNQMVFTLTSNTNLRISVRGSDGVTRVANLTLA